MGVKVLVTRLDKDLPLPNYAKGGDAGADLVSRVDSPWLLGSANWYQLAFRLHFLMVT